MVSLGLHAVVLGCASPAIWFDGARSPQPMMTITIAPVPLVLEIPAPPPPQERAPPPPLSVEHHKSTERPALQTARIQVPASRFVAAMSALPKRSQFRPVFLPIDPSSPAHCAQDAGASAGPVEPPTGAVAATTRNDPLAHPGYRHTPVPAYPRVAKLHGWEGVTVLRLEVLESGKVGKVELVRSSGHSVLDETAVKTAQQWCFEPARRAGVAVVCVVEVPIRFKLADSGG